MTVSPSPDMIELNIPGLPAGMLMQLHGSGDQIISAKLRQERCWEAYETSLTLQHLHPGDVYVDVGANIGYYTLIAAQRVGVHGKVIAYEPDTDNFALLQRNVALNQLSHVRIFPCALSDKNETGQLFLSEDNFGDHRIYGSGDHRKTRNITLLKGDEHVGQQTGRIDFLKIDTQGSEYFVVNGLHGLLEKNRGHLRMILEFCPYGIRHSGADGHELVRLLQDMKMQYHIIDHQQQCLIPAEAYHLDDWVSEMADDPLNEGFINLLVTPSADT
ncbi:MAG TPA: FkbM family methyltransferase [Pseudomonadales bacterium]|nr:FkbM family methyltransferase [Pseudomonadales bacterium]